MPRQKTKEDLEERIDELEAENEALQGQVDAIFRHHRGRGGRPEGSLESTGSANTSAVDGGSDVDEGRERSD
jgi:hypothetical protein